MEFNSSKKNLIYESNWMSESGNNEIKKGKENAKKSKQRIFIISFSFLFLFLLVFSKCIML